MLETTLIGGILGSLMRLAPEVFKFLDRKDERKHELAMLDKEQEFAKIQAEVQMRTIDATVIAKEYDALAVGLEAQGKADSNAYKWVASLSALVRPLVTYAFVFVYFAVKLVSYLMALDQGGAWDAVLVSLWTENDLGILSMILSFWFIGRAIEKRK